MNGRSRENLELRGDVQGKIVTEGETVTVYVTIAAQGVGTLSVRVLDPNRENAPVANAEVRVDKAFFGDWLPYDFTVTDPNGVATFQQMPADDYQIAVFSKATSLFGSALVKVEPFLETRKDILLQMHGQVRGFIRDGNNPATVLPGLTVTLGSVGFETRTTSGPDGKYVIDGVREGSFRLEVLDPVSFRRGYENGTLTQSQPVQDVDVLLEKTYTFHAKVVYPADDGTASSVEVPYAQAELTQRCYDINPDSVFEDIRCDYWRRGQLPGVLEGVLQGEDGELVIDEIGGAQRTIYKTIHYPDGASETNPYVVVLPASGTVRVTISQANGGRVQNARVQLGQRVAFTDANGLVVFNDVPLGKFRVSAATIDDTFTAVTGELELRSQSTPYDLPITLGAYLTLTGRVLSEDGAPSVGTHAVATFNDKHVDILTDGEGRYKFVGIIVQSGQLTPVKIELLSADESVVGAVINRSFAGNVAGTTVDLGDTRMDSTLPRVLSVLPENNAQNVSPDAHITVVLSEYVQETSFPFTLSSADNETVGFTATTTRNATDHTQTITLVPQPAPGSPLPLRSNTLYVLVVKDVTDLNGHQMLPRAFNFTTADYIAPKVVKVAPPVTQAVQKSTTFAVTFNKAIAREPVESGATSVHVYEVAGPEEDAAVTGNVNGLAGAAQLDALGTTLSFIPNEFLVEAKYYRLEIIGARDASGNVADPIKLTWHSWDENDPFIVLQSPVPAGYSLTAGVGYTIAPQFHDVDANGAAATDIAEVDWYVNVDGVDKPVIALKKPPFDYYLVPGADVRHVTLRAQATDDSLNKGPMSDPLALDVLPNLPPKNLALTLLHPEAA